MTTTRPILTIPMIGSLLLGRFSVWLGLALAPIYLTLFVLATSQGGVDRPAITPIALPTLLPYVGIGVAALGTAIARMAGRPMPWICVAGLAIHALVLALATALPLTMP